MNRALERLKNGIITENPTFVLILGMCPTLAVTTSAINGLGMGLSTTVILVMSNLMIAALRKVIPNRMRIPAYIVIVASFVTIIDFLLQAYLPSLSESLGGYIKLIVVNCIILGRAESYASKNPVIPSIFDGLGMGLGFTIGLTAIGIVRELLGAGSIFGFTIPLYKPIGIFVLSPGAFIVLAFLIAIINANKIRRAKKGLPIRGTDVCRTGDCTGCTNSSCSGRFYDVDGEFGSVASVMAARSKVKDQEQDIAGIRASKRLKNERKTDEERLDEKIRKKKEASGMQTVEHPTVEPKVEEEIPEKAVVTEELSNEVNEFDETPVVSKEENVPVEESVKENSAETEVEESVKEETIETSAEEPAKADTEEIVSEETKTEEAKTEETRTEEARGETEEVKAEEAEVAETPAQSQNSTGSGNKKKKHKKKKGGNPTNHTEKPAQDKKPDETKQEEVTENE